MEVQYARDDFRRYPNAIGVPLLKHSGHFATSITTMNNNELQSITFCPGTPGLDQHENY